MINIYAFSHYQIGASLRAMEMAMAHNLIHTDRNIVFINDSETDGKALLSEEHDYVQYEDFKSMLDVVSSYEVLLTEMPWKNYSLIIDNASDWLVGIRPPELELDFDDIYMESDVELFNKFIIDLVKLSKSNEVSIIANEIILKQIQSIIPQHNYNIVEVEVFI